MLKISSTILTAFFCTSFFAPAAWSDPTTFNNRGKIKFDKRRFDFGDVFRGEVLTHVFPFKNIGDGVLSIHGVHASCGCTAVELDKNKSYRPGESGQIEVNFNTTDFTGRVTKIVTVITNEKVLPDRSLTLGANVKSEFDVQPPLFLFNESRLGDNLPKVVKIKPIGKFTFDLKSIEYNRSVLDINHKTDGQTLILTAALKPGVAPGFIKDNVFINTSSKIMPRLTVPVRATVKGYVEYSPEYLEFGAIPAGDKSNRALRLNGDDDVKITGTRAEIIINGKKVEDSIGFVKIESTADSTSKRQVSIELKNNSDAVGNVHGKIFLVTDHEQQKEIEVNFYAFFR